MSALNLNAEGAETQSPAYRDGYQQGKEHKERHNYRPEINPHEAATSQHKDWDDGYEKGWADTFFAKVQQRREQPQLNFQNQNQHTS